jgi:hypothetical protein
MEERVPHHVYDSVNPWAGLLDLPRQSRRQWDASSNPNERNPPPKEISTYWSFPIRVRPDQMNCVIGKNGSVFKSITESVPGGLYIWFDKGKGTEGHIEIWGTNKEALASMKTRLMKRMALIKKNNP